MKTARITFLGTEQFKAQLVRQAAAQHISVGELIRSQFESKPEEDERQLEALAEDLKRATADTRRALSEAMAEVETTLKELGERRQQTSNAA
jgi:ABC-type transporter Mla subunit MlaD